MTKKMTKKKRFIAGLAAVLLIVSLAYIGCGYRTPEKRADRIAQKIIKDLDLNEAQQEKLQSTKVEFLTKGLEMRKAHRSTRKELKEQLSSDKIDQAALQKMYTDHKVKMDELVSLFTVRLAEFHSTLSPEQKTKLVAKLDSMERKHRRWGCRQQ
ncbi:MAG: Spy/CpxP family protein refolding chaperone [Deltaproteobacteria bacterium]|nr:Spy/CpxP family protein refolding chaperone [Deltaproteobacteria bacterium]